MRQYKTQYYELKLTFAPPFLSQASGTLALGNDVAMQRYQDEPVINGSLIRGNIRGALEGFVAVLGEEQTQAKAKAKALNRFIYSWFGKPARNEKQEATLTTERSRLSFDLFWKLQGDAPKASQRTRIQLESSGKVKEGALQVVEDCFPFGSGDIIFTGYLQAKLSQDAQQQKAEKITIKRNLQLALDSISAMGSLKGIGFGELKNATLEESESPQVLKSDTLNGDETRIGIRFTLDRPFCLGKPRTPESNRIVSDSVITGNVIKGVMAEALRGQDNWTDLFCFDDLSVSHALPVAQVGDTLQASQAQTVIPLSMAFVESGASKSEVLVDFATISDPMSQKWGHLSRAPVFQPDWKKKHCDEANNEFNTTLGSPNRLVLVRTGINQQSGVSEESQLFSLECIDPTGFVWEGEISLAQVEETRRAGVVSALRAFFADGLEGIGKTKASEREVELFPLQSVAAPGVLPDLVVGDEVVVTLTSDSKLIASGFERVVKQASLRSLYQEYWNTFELVDFYAQQYREGGQWHHLHYQDKNLKKEAYAPEWLTKAGSVFVLKVQSQRAIDQLREWSVNGLPAASEALSKRPTWQTTPYLPEHGFGRIKVNCPIQLSFTLKQEVSHG